MGGRRSGLRRGLCGLAACALAAGCGPNRPTTGAASAANDAGTSAANDAVASAVNGAVASGWTPESDDVAVDLFTAASPDRWTPLRNKWHTLVAVDRLTPKRDAAIVTWQAGGQMWCGTAIPVEKCEGGRFLKLIVKPQALPGAASLGDREAAITLTVNGVVSRQMSSDFGAKADLTNYVVQAPIPHLHAFLLMVHYGREGALRRQLDRCREITVGLLGRRFAFTCDGLPADEP